jgi:hypothetical protein
MKTKHFPIILLYYWVNNLIIRSSKSNKKTIRAFGAGRDSMGEISPNSVVG